MNSAYLLIGGNIGDRMSNLALAKESLQQECGIIIKTSSIYETEAWGNNDQPAFLNQAIFISTKLSVTDLMNCILNVEKKIGRIRKDKYEPRIIDIDIIFFNNDFFSNFVVTVPHPELQNRRFVLVPLVEIAENYLHPVLKKSCKELLDECKDDLVVKKFS